MTIDAPFKIVRSLDMTIEVDQFIVDAESSSLHQEEQLELSPILEQLATAYPGKDCDEQGNVNRVFDDLHVVYAKAPGMLSFAIGPVEDVGEVRIELETFQRELSQILQEAGLRCLVVGSLAATDEVPPLRAETILSFKRNDGVLTEKATELAEAIAPLLALLCDNSPVESDEGNIVHARTLHDAGLAVECNGSRLTLRVADTLPAPYATAFVTLAKGLFATDEALEAALIILGRPNQSAIGCAWDAIGSEGFDAVVYEKPAHELAGALIERACATLASNEHNYLSPLRQLARMRKTLTMLGSGRR